MASNRHPDRELIEAIGREVLRQQFSLSHQRLHAWTVRGVPYTHRAAVANLATLRNCPVPASFLLPPADMATVRPTPESATARAEAA